MYKNGVRTEFNSVEDRYHRDPVYRARMLENGWTWDSVGMIDRIATTEPGENTGRTRAQITTQEGWYYKFQDSGAAGGSNPQLPDFRRTQERIWSSFRRAQTTARWATRDDDNNYHSRWATGDVQENRQPWETSDTTILPFERQWFGWWNETRDQPSDRWATGDDDRWATGDGWHSTNWDNR